MNYLKNKNESPLQKFIVFIVFIAVGIFLYNMHIQSKSENLSRCSNGTLEVMDKKGNWIQITDKYEKPIKCGSK